MTVARRLAHHNPGAGGPPPGPSGSALKDKPKVVGAYYPQWEYQYPEDIHAGINLLLVSFAVPGTPSGAMRWDGMYSYDDAFGHHNALDQATMEASIQTAREAGRTVLLSLGGEFTTYLLNTDEKVTNLVNSIAGLYTDWGGFDGIDYDIENQATPTPYYVAAARALKDLYGGDFSISMSYAGNDSDPGGAPTTYKFISRELESTGELDLSTIQYYDYSPAAVTGDVMTRVGQLVNDWDILPEHIGIGVKHDSASPSSTWTTAQMLSMWNTVEATYPTIRGMNLWETIEDRTKNGNAFATTISNAILT